MSSCYVFVALTHILGQTRQIFKQRKMGLLQLTVTWYEIASYCRASYVLGRSKERKVKHNWLRSLCFRCPGALLAL